MTEASSLGHVDRARLFPPQFLWPLFSQQLTEVIAGLETAWAFFGGIPRYVVLDNFPAAIVGADPLNPRLSRGFLEYVQHRGFIADPARPGHPKDKPKVEREVPYVRERFFKGGQFNSLADLAEPGQGLVPKGGRAEGPRHHPAFTIGSLSGRGTD